MFGDSDNKRAIRERYNLPFLSMLCSRVGRRLAYLGLPGAALNDLIDWESVLDVKTCVQIVRKARLQREEDLGIISEMSSNLLVRDIKHAEIVRGSVEDLILTGRSIDGVSPKLAVDDPSGLLFRYDIYNLDFLGGIAYRRPSQGSIGQKAPRIKAIEQLFARQRGQDFGLLLTLNVRDTFGDEPVQFLQEAAQRTENDLLKEVASWGASLSEGFNSVKRAGHELSYSVQTAASLGSLEGASKPIGPALQTATKTFIYDESSSVSDCLSRLGDQGGQIERKHEHEMPCSKLSRNRSPACKRLGPLRAVTAVNASDIPWM